jgi:hypothetical protein
MSLAGDVVSHILAGAGRGDVTQGQSAGGRSHRVAAGHGPDLAVAKPSHDDDEIAIGVIFTAALAIGTVLTPSEA